MPSQPHSDLSPAVVEQIVHEIAFREDWSAAIEKRWRLQEAIGAALKAHGEACGRLALQTQREKALAEVTRIGRIKGAVEQWAGAQSLFLCVV